VWVICVAFFAYFYLFGVGLGVYGQWAVFFLLPAGAGVFLDGELATFVWNSTTISLSSGGILLMLCDLRAFYNLCHLVFFYVWLWPGYVFYIFCLIPGYIHSWSGNLNYCNRCGGTLFMRRWLWLHFEGVGILSVCIFSLYLFLFSHVPSSIRSVIVLLGCGYVIDRCAWFVVILYFVF